MSELENRDEIYYQRYEELRGLVFQAYADVYLLEEFEHYNEKVNSGRLALPRCSYLVMRHICHLILADLGLTVWKITDDESCSNTIVTLKRYLAKEHNKPSTYSLDRLTKHTIDVLNKIRNEYLAHNDIGKHGYAIAVSSLKSALDDIRKCLNELCFPELDDRVFPIENEIFKEAYDMKLGLELLFEGANMVDPSEESKKS